MTPAQMAVYLLDKAGISKVQGKAALDELSTLTVRELKREGTRLAGLGIFRKRKTKARILPQSHHRRADQDSRPHAAALHPRQGAEGSTAGRPAKAGYASWRFHRQTASQGGMTEGRARSFMYGERIFR